MLKSHRPAKRGLYLPFPTFDPALRDIILRFLVGERILTKIQELIITMLQKNQIDINDGVVELLFFVIWRALSKK